MTYTSVFIVKVTSVLGHRHLPWQRHRLMHGPDSDVYSNVLWTLQARTSLLWCCQVFETNTEPSHTLSQYHCLSVKSGIKCGFGSNLCQKLCSTWKVLEFLAQQDGIFHIIVRKLGFLARVTTALMRLLSYTIAMQESEARCPSLKGLALIIYVYFVTKSVHAVLWAYATHRGPSENSSSSCDHLSVFKTATMAPQTGYGRMQIIWRSY